MYETIISALEEGNTDTATNLIVITGEGDYFTSGIDLSSGPPKSGSQEQKPVKRKTLYGNLIRIGVAVEKIFNILVFILVFFSGCRKFMTTLIDLRKPLIALVNGPAHGVGVTMLGLCDAVYCSDRVWS